MAMLHAENPVDGNQQRSIGRYVAIDLKKLTEKMEPEIRGESIVYRTR
jgi:hypothetical protein